MKKSVNHRSRGKKGTVDQTQSPFSDLGPDDDVNLLVRIAAAGEVVVRSFRTKETLSKVFDTVSERDKNLDPQAFDFEILRALDDVEQLINPQRHPFGSEQRGELLKFFSSTFNGLTVLATASYQLLQLHDEIMKCLGVEEEISARRAPASLKIEYDSFLCHAELNSPIEESLSDLENVVDAVLTKAQHS